MTAAVAGFFDALERGDTAAVLALCADDVLVRNAGEAPRLGKAGARAYAEEFCERTSRRHFDVLAIAEGPGVAFARWTGAWTYRGGIVFGGLRILRPFTLNLAGICRFGLDPRGGFGEIDIHHETTTVMGLARAASDPNRGA